MFAHRKAETDWKFVDGTFTKPRQLHLAKGTDGLDYCPVKWGIGQSGQISYVASISDLLHFRKFNCPPGSVLQNFAITKVYVNRARKCLAKDVRSNWTTE